MTGKTGVSRLTEEQRALLDGWLGDWGLVEDLSWPLGITVLRLQTSRGHVVVKASEVSHHIEREIRAHRRMTEPLMPHAPRYLHGDVTTRVLVTEWLPGRLVQGGPLEHDPGVFGQAGRLLRLFQRPERLTSGYDEAAVHKIGDFADRATDLVDEASISAFREMAAAHRPEPRQLHATHGDYQPRNWIEDAGTVKVIDFGRAGYRPWVTDLVRLEHLYFTERNDPDGLLRTAFYEGHGRDPREERGSWLLDNLLQALGTVVWAHDVGEETFENHGREMIRRIIEWFS